MTRPRLALLQRVARDVAQAARAGAAPAGPLTAQRTGRDATADELARRLDETRERLRREIPPARDDPSWR